MNRREAIQTLAAGASAMTIATNGVANEANTSSVDQKFSIEREEIRFWLETSLKRVFPNSPVGGPSTFEMLAARNEKISFQACVRNLRTSMVRVRVAVPGAEDWKVRIRRVGYVPMHGLNTAIPKADLEGIGHVPGLVPDPLFPEEVASIGPESNSSFWISLTIPAEAQPGIRTLKVVFTLEGDYGFPEWTKMEPWSVELPAQVEVCQLVIQGRKDFQVTHWFNAESIWEWYKIEPYCERFWELTEAYIRNMVEHGLDVAYVPIFNARHEKLNRPVQLVKVREIGEKTWEFDLSDVRRWIHTAIKCGAKYVEFTHFFTPAPTSAKHPQRVFHRWEQTGDMLWPFETDATSETYRSFLSQFLPLFKKVLEEEGVLDRALFHCADEPDGDAQMADYRKARAMLKELAPWIKVMDAMSEPRFATERLSDMPIPSIVTAPLFAKAGCPAWTYFCCGPRGPYLQRLLDTPLTTIRMSGWLFYRMDAKGFLHWGHNYWFKFCTPDIADPFLDASLGSWPGLPYGDPFVVYPGENGPIDSIRWEVFSESLQDYALLQSVKTSKTDAMLDGIKDYQDFPKSADWILSARKRLLLGKDG